MKKIFNIAILACLVAAACTGCKPNEPNSGEKEFAFAAQYEIDYGTPTADDSTLIENAFHKAGVSLGEYTMVFTGDSASVRKQLEEKMAPVMESLMVVPDTIRVWISVKGAEKKYVDAENDKEHPITIWYSQRAGAPENWEVLGNGISMTGLYNSYHDYRFVKYLRTGYGFWSPNEGEYWVLVGPCVNDGAGGDYIYLALEHCLGAWSKNSADQFIWEDAYANQILTDVIVVYGANAPNTVVVDGRTYNWQNQTCDQNKGAGGKYVWFYGTTDPVEGEEGYYLITGAYYGGYCCRMYGFDKLHNNEKGNVSDFLNQPRVESGHRIIERVVKAYDYDDNMKCVGAANLNAGIDGATRRNIIFTYATKDKVE